jgi:uncharacterized protein
VKRFALIGGGYLMLAIGAIGVLVPVLPTTPFVLVAASCFAASSPKTYAYLLRSRLFGPYVKHYRMRCGIPPSAKIKGITALWVLLGISAIFVKESWIYVLLSTVGIAVTAHLLKIPTQKKDHGDSKQLSES